MVTNSVPNKGLHLDWCSHEAAKYAVEHWHYSKCMPVGKLVKVGVWEDGQFIGVVVFGQGNNQFQGQSLGISIQEICELTRVAMRAHKCSVTRVVKLALMMLKRQCPGLRCVFSYADPEQGHVGSIYQGGNWVFVGTGGSSEAFFGKDGKRLHSRVVSASGVKDHFGKVKPCVRKDECTVKKLAPKYKYLMPLDAEMREKVQKLAKPYPKRVKQATSSDQEGSGGASPTHPLQNLGLNG